MMSSTCWAAAARGHPARMAPASPARRTTAKAASGSIRHLGGRRRRDTLLQSRKAPAILPVSGPPSLAPALEILHGALVLLRGGAGLERAQIAPLPGLGVFLSGV